MVPQKNIVSGFLNKGNLFQQNIPLKTKKKKASLKHKSQDKCVQVWTMESLFWRYFLQGQWDFLFFFCAGFTCGNGGEKFDIL